MRRVGPLPASPSASPSVCVPVLKAISRPSGDQASDPTPSGKAASVTTSPPAVTGATCSVALSCLGLPGSEGPEVPRSDVKANLLPSGDQQGSPSRCSPEVKGTGGVVPSTA